MNALFDGAVMGLPARVWVALMIGLAATPVSAQPASDRVVGSGGSREALVVNAVDSITIGRLAAASGVPMGFVGWQALATTQFRAIPASGRRLGEVLDAMVSADPRYAWTDDDGVIVVTATSGLEQATRFLDTVTGGATLENVDSADALDVVARLVGARRARSGPGDTKTFSVTLAATATMRDLLNAIVRAHGTLAWAMTPSGVADPPLHVMLHAGASGHGLGVSRDTLRRGSLPIHGPIVHRREAPLEPLLDRIVAHDGASPLRMQCINPSFVLRLASAVGVPMGIEMAGDRHPCEVPDRVLTGLRLRDVLLALSARQATYEWREMDGVIVFRPRSAWMNGDDPLFQIVPEVQVHDDSTQKAIEAVLSRFGVPEAGDNNFPETRHITLDQPQGTALDLLNALAAAHGQLVWTWEDLEPRMSGLMGRRYQLSFGVFSGGGIGYSVP